MEPFVLETDRLRLRWLTEDDAAFLCALLNDPDFLHFIGDRGVRTEAGARAYARERIRPHYAAHGFGMYAVVPKDGAHPVGLCGLVRRDGLDGVDLGFAFLPAWRRRGYAVEAARAVIAHARRDAGLTRLLAITQPDNTASIRTLESLGFRYERMVRLPGEDDDLRLYALPIPAPPGAVTGPS